MAGVHELIGCIHEFDPDERECKIRFQNLGAILNARKEVLLMESVISQLSELDKTQSFGIIEIKQRVRCIERIFRRTSNNTNFPQFHAGLPPHRWEIDTAKALNIIDSNWEAKLEEIGIHQFPIFEEYKRRINGEFRKWTLEVIESCKIEKVDREGAAKMVELVVFLGTTGFSLCIPIVVGLVLSTYLNAG